jgi:Arc/MetJ-type ribon-helix-helix transcriptional regulator
LGGEVNHGIRAEIQHVDALAPNRAPNQLCEFTEECVRLGLYPSVGAVVRAALDDKQHAVLRNALDLGIAELDAGLGVECSPDELMREISIELGLDTD